MLTMPGFVRPNSGRHIQALVQRKARVRANTSERIVRGILILPDIAATVNERLSGLALRPGSVLPQDRYLTSRRGIVESTGVSNQPSRS
jgi:hypothetical protein